MAIGCVATQRSSSHCCRQLARFVHVLSHLTGHTRLHRTEASAAGCNLCFASYPSECTVTTWGISSCTHQPGSRQLDAPASSTVGDGLCCCQHAVYISCKTQAGAGIQALSALLSGTATFVNCIQMLLQGQLSLWASLTSTAMRVEPSMYDR